jgi:hypothetical protein
MSTFVRGVNGIDIELSGAKTVRDLGRRPAVFSRPAVGRIGLEAPSDECQHRKNRDQKEQRMDRDAADDREHQEQ